MWKFVAILVVIVVYTGEYAEAADCCASYTDFLGKYHSSFLCEDYCCLNPSLGKLKQCCSNVLLRVSTDERNEECFKSWVEEHVWVPIVGGIVTLIIFIALCTCCCCCGCCTCCRKPAPVYIHSPGVPQTTVAMQQQTTVANPVHYGYDQ